METFEPGDVIDGKYTITKVLGRGGMGLVVAASQPGLDTPVAIKVLLPELRDKPEIAARFAREARAANRLRSEHVARVYSVGTTPSGTPFIVMEYLEGDDLAVVIKARGRFDVADAVDLVLPAFEAIAEAHGQGIVHRDLKPANLFVTKALGGLPFVKVLDFGISKASFPDDLVKTDTSSFFGSPLYMSPEQLTRPKFVDMRSDIWALGIILYEMVAGVTPFTGETLASVCAAIIGGTFAKLSTIRADVPPELDALIAEALAPSQESRLPSVEAFAKRLAPFGGEGARLSYERIARLAGGMTVPDAPRPEVVDVNLLADTAPPVARSLDPKPEAGTRDLPPVPAKKPSAARTPILLALTSVAIAGAVFGIRQTHKDGPAATPMSSSTVAADVAPSASALPSASAEPPAPASASATPAPVVIGDSVMAPNAPVSKTSALDECAKGATPACEAACAAHKPGRCEALAKVLVKGSAADVVRGQALYQTDCTAGIGAACTALAALAEAKKDNANAMRLYTQGCDLHDRPACTSVGTMYFLGAGVSHDYEHAATFFGRACPSTGPVDARACVNLSIAYASGQGVPTDRRLGVTFAQKACDNGNGLGCTRVATAKLTGDGIGTDVAGAIRDLDTACTKLEASACKELVTVYSRGIGVPVDGRLYREYLDKACKANDAYSCGLRDRVQKDDSEETSMAVNTGQLEASCNAGVMVNCGLLGERAWAGQGMPADRPRGIALLDRACKAGVARACQKLAEVQR